MRIYLIGFMGSGKTTLGQRAATFFEVPFVDTDSVIEAQAGLSITEIFTRFGEEYFRQLEADVLKQTAFYEKSIIATGGGLPSYHDNMAWMSHHGITVYLHWNEAMIQSNLSSHQHSRPLLAGLDEADTGKKISTLLSHRKPFYEQSAITIEMEGDTERDLEQLVRVCRYIW